MIEIRNLVRRYGTVTAVDNLDLKVPAGELFCFLGPNGAGKTTTLKILTGLLRPTSGTVRVAGMDVTQDAVAVKRIIGYIPDMPFLYDRLTATEFFEFSADLYNIPHAVARRKLDELFSLFSLQEQRDALVRELSHGMRQRLIYAVTFLHDPRILFIDEPLIGLDPYTIRLIKNLLREKVRNGMTVFLTTHILALAEDVADRIGIIYKGRLIALGTLTELVERSGGTQRLEDIFLKLTAE